jgi:hypothetical protein
MVYRYAASVCCACYLAPDAVLYSVPTWFPFAAADSCALPLPFIAVRLMTGICGPAYLQHIFAVDWTGVVTLSPRPGWSGPTANAIAAANMAAFACSRAILP